MLGKKKQHYLFLNFIFLVSHSLTAMPLDAVCTYLMSLCFLQNRTAHYFSVSCSVFWVWTLARAADSWHSSKELNMRKLISPSNLSANNGCCSVEWLACAQVLSGVSHVQLSGYLFVYSVIIIIISFTAKLNAFVVRISTSFSITFCFSLLLFGWKFPEMMFSKNLQNKKQIVSGEFYLPFLFSALLATQRFH